MSERDEIFAQPLKQIPPFSFDEKVARVFDDMARRSIPLYVEMQHLCAQICAQFYRGEGIIYDLGCSTGNTLLAIADLIRKGAKVRACDTSVDMLSICRRKLEDYGLSHNVELFETDVMQMPLAKAEGILMHYVAQFLPPENRFELYKRLFNAVSPSGFLIISEKLQIENTHIHQSYTKSYIDWKVVQGYSELEIAQKRTALENVLIPSTETILRRDLHNAGFGSVETLLRWGPFATFLALP